MPSHVHSERSPVMPVQFQGWVKAAVSRAPSFRNISDAVTIKTLIPICSHGLKIHFNKAIQLVACRTRIGKNGWPANINSASRQRWETGVAPGRAESVRDTLRPLEKAG